MSLLELHKKTSSFDEVIRKFADLTGLGRALYPAGSRTKQGWVLSRLSRKTVDLLSDAAFEAASGVFVHCTTLGGLVGCGSKLVVGFLRCGRITGFDSFECGTT